MRLTVLTVSIATCLFVSACATPQPTWRKAGTTADDTHTALAECRYQIKLNKIPVGEQEQVIADCMESKGFRWRLR